MSNNATQPRPSLKSRWRAGDLLLGIFTRLTAPESYETLAHAGLDFIIMDTEHGSFSRESISRCLFAARAGGLDVIVRMPDANHAEIQHAIGAGAAGIIIPHVSDAGAMKTVVRFARGIGLERGYAGANRISKLRSVPWPSFQAAMAEDLLVIAQLDEPAGLAVASDVIAIEGLDAVFLGRIGLTLAMQSSGKADDVDGALERVSAECRARALPVGLSITDEKAAAQWRAHGVTLFSFDSDHTLLLNGARGRSAQFRTALGGSLPK